MGTSPEPALRERALDRTSGADVAPERVQATLGAAKAAWARRHLATDVVGWLTTQSPDGRLQSSVISFLWDGETILVYSQPDTPKIRNIEHDPAVSFHLSGDRYGDHGLIMEGVAEIDRSTPPGNVHPAFREKHRGPLAHSQMDPDEAAATFSVPIRIRPTRVRTW